MSASQMVTAGRGLLFFFVRTMRTLFGVHPEWWAWVLCLSVWAYMVTESFAANRDARSAGHYIYCIKPGTTQTVGSTAYGAGNNQSKENIASGMIATIEDGLLPWMLMIIAMMFPLLVKPIQHVAFSIRRKDRNWGIVWFLTEYITIWIVAGIILLVLLFLLYTFVIIQPSLVNGLLPASGFVLATLVTWLAGRPVRMMKCSQTMPIRIQGWQLHTDSLLYGLKTGVSCLILCWAPMVALLLAHHNFTLMYIVTVVLIYERYLLRHTSKLPAYAWALIALVLVVMEMSA